MKEGKVKVYHLIGVVPFAVVSAYIILFNFLWRWASTKLSAGKAQGAMGAVG